MTKIEELENILETGCTGECEKCKLKKECKELEELWKREEEKGFKAGQVYQNEDTNIFIKRVNCGLVSFIEGYSPCAIHNMQEIPEENLAEYIKKWGFKKSA